MENLLIFITTAGVLMLFLSVTGLVVMILRQRRSTQHSKGKGNNTKKSSTSNYVKSPQLGFVLPTHVPKTVSYVNSSALRNPNEELNLDMIDPELYHTTRNERSESLPSLPGSLCFSVQYEKETEKLIVGIIRGQRLWPKSSNPTATPYVKICLLPDKRKKLQTKPRQKTPNPLFNEEFYFYCPFSELRQRCLRFTVCDFDRFSRQNVIGTVIFSLDDNFEKILSIEGCVEVWRDIEDYETESCNCFGEILFSLQYLPTAKRLTIAILKGKSFGIQGNGKDPSIYVKITMICGGKATRSRKTTKKHDIDPIFNESFHFDASDTLFDRTSFTLAVVNSKRLIGRVVVGPFLHATGTGLTHWNDMLNSPHNAVAMWHTLL